MRSVEGTWWEVLVAVLILLRRLGGNGKHLKDCPGGSGARGPHGAPGDRGQGGTDSTGSPGWALHPRGTVRDPGHLQRESCPKWKVAVDGGGNVVPACLGRKLSLELSLLPGGRQAAGSSPPRFLPSLHLRRCWAPSRLCLQGPRIQPRRMRPTASWLSSTR